MLETKEQVIIMAHKNPDMDAFGSGIGIYKMVAAMGKKAHIVVNEVSSRSVLYMEASHRAMCIRRI